MNKVIGHLQVQINDIPAKLEELKKQQSDLRERNIKLVAELDSIATRIDYFKGLQQESIQAITLLIDCIDNA